MNRLLNQFRGFACAVVIGTMATAASLPFAPAPALAQARAVTLDEAVAALRAISTLRANFTQTDRNGQRVSGVLTLKRPGRIRFQYEDAVNMLIVGDGKALTLVDYDVRQVQRWPIKNSPLGALLDPSRDVARYGKLMPVGSPGIASVEVRDTKHPEYGIITMTFVRDASAPGGLRLAGWVSLDSQNQRTAIRLSGHRYGLAIPNSAFRWKDPRRKVRR
jgi:outer membrane lipoprotein-sorting protein